MLWEGFRGRLTDYRVVYAVPGSELENARKAIMQIKDSTSWKVTKPLRWIGKKLHG